MSSYSKNTQTRLFITDDGEEWIQHNKPKVDSFLQELQDAQGHDELKIIDGAPFCSIREIQEDGTDIYLGSLDITRCLEKPLLDVDSERAQQKADINKSLEAGDPNIIWSFGGMIFTRHIEILFGKIIIYTFPPDYLSPSYHGQGIMTDAMDTLLYKWAIPRMNVRKIISCAFIGNQGSVRVFEKNGFLMTRTIQEHEIVRGEMRGSHVMEWTLEESREA